VVLKVFVLGMLQHVFVATVSDARTEARFTAYDHHVRPSSGLVSAALTLPKARQTESLCPLPIAGASISIDIEL